MKKVWLAIAAFLLTASACGSHNTLWTSSSDAIVVGAKNFSEQALLGEILAQQIARRTDFQVDKRFNLGGTLIAHEALLAGQLDAYIEYTGTALTAILKKAPVSSSAEALRVVRDAYRELGVEWVDPLGFNNTFAILVRGEDARQLGLRTISDAVPHAGRWRPGFGYEFKERKDGFEGLVTTYGLQFGAPARFMELGLLYPALASKQIDLAAGNSTDGLIAALDLFVLKDDRGYFPPYDAAILVRKETIDSRPGLLPALQELSGTISEELMRRMNYDVDGNARSVKEVAAEFLAGLNSESAREERH